MNAKKNNYDYTLFAVTIGLVLFGILMVYSASSYSAEFYYGNKYYFMFKQMIGAVLGFIAMIVMSRIDYHILDKLKYIILCISVVLLVLVFIPGIGIENYGARRWINLPFFTLQASELSKFGFIIFSAGYMAKNYRKMTSFVGMLPVLAVGGIICFLIILEPNMSITICVMVLMFAMLFIGGARIKYFILLAIPVVIAFVVLILVEPYRLNRLMAFFDPWESPLEEGYQLIQSYYALGSGGFFGLGLFNSRQKYLFLPFAESDFIFSIIGEELGLFGCLLVIIAYVLMIYRCLKISKNSNDRFGCYLSSGIAFIIAIQVLVNIAVVSGSIPPTGLPLPFISAGSTSIIVFCSGIGVVENVCKLSHPSVKLASFKPEKVRKSLKKAKQKI